jgi:hypothetical protein
MGRIGCPETSVTNYGTNILGDLKDQVVLKERETQIRKSQYSVKGERCVNYVIIAFWKRV